jgi:hypothetical protein
MPPPVQAAEAQGILQMLAGAGGPAAGMGAGPGQAPSPQAPALQAATQQLDGANPQGMSTMLQQINDTLAQAYLMAAMRVPDMAEDISKARSSLQRAIKKAEEAAKILQTVKPIANTAAIGPQAGGPAQPDISALLAQGSPGM